MSEASVRRRPSLWSYFSFGSAAERNRQRHPSISYLARNDSIDDPYRKAVRNGDANGSAVATALNGSGAASMTSSQRSRYLKAGGVIAFVLFLLFFLSPSSKVVTNIGGGGQTASDPAAATTKCQKSSDPSKPLIQYALMIDAGSTGSRIHVYRFNNCGSTPELESEEFKMTEKKQGGSGLSSFKADAEGAAKSLDPLMQVAMDTVPDSYKSCSPIAVKATAGLRLLGTEMSDKILDAVRHRLETAYPFPVVAKEKGGVEIMDGKDEGVYAWITTNYLLGKIGGPDKTPTAAVFDLGGGSTQVVFEPTFPMAAGGMPETLAPGDHKYDLKFGGREFNLYQHSHLGYGLMSARQTIHKVVVEALLENRPSSDRSWITQGITNPCIAPGMTREVVVEDVTKGGNNGPITVNMTGPSVIEGTTAAQCRGLAEKILEKEAECELAPCSFNGVHQPSLAKTFAREDVFIFSYFFDRTEPLGMPESFTLREMKDLASRVCAGEAAGGWDVFAGVEGALPQLKDRPEWCLDLSFMLALLHTGYEMPLDREVKIAKKIKGNELGWCLGASLPLLSQESGWQCRLKEVKGPGSDSPPPAKQEGGA
ncbi:MAG: Guanosine-diphosphatase [Chaenotheca gracillima]|nr:MAG: Guanosine-diphosphatase [Chaenotheca gracillima]